MPHSKRTVAGVAGGLLGLVGLSVVAGVLVTATMTPAVAATSAAATSAIDMFNNLPSVLTIDKLILPSTIYAKDEAGNETPMATYYDQNRSPVTFDQVAPVMYDAILSSEDPRFYQHGGIDPIGTVRALLSNLRGGAPQQGGSSISQQYVKNVLIQQCDWTAKTDKELNACWVKASDSSGPEGYQRKLQEMRYAIALEQRYSKNDILLGYLNIANFGGTTYGIDAAAMHYFGVHASQLNLAQAATLAGMVQNPNTFRIDQPTSGTTTDSKGQPVNDAKDGYKLTKQRQEYVLGRMLAYGKITKTQYDEADKAPITPNITDNATGCAASSAPYFCAYVTSTILTDPAFGATVTDRQQLLRKGGLKIYTTLDPTVQAAAQAAQNQYSPSYVQNMQFGSASVSVQVNTGRVLAMAQNTQYIAAGTPQPGQSSIVYAGDLKQGGSTGFNAGSTFKLFTLLDWLEQGHSLNERVNGTNRVISTWNDQCLPGGKLNAKADINNFNSERGYYGTPMQFTAQSLNTGFLGMASELDLCDIGKMAARLGVTRGNGTPIPLGTSGGNKISADNPAPYEILGSDNVSPLAMAAAYATVANNGIYCQPRVIDKVVGSDGAELPLPKRTCSQVLDPKIAATAAYALAGVMRGGGSGATGNPNDGTPLIGKTGTHQDLQTWLITSNTQVTTANWIGNATGQGDLFHKYYKGNVLSNLRYLIARSIQRVVDQAYPGGQFPQPDANLTRQVLVALPSVIGMSQDSATATLQAAGFDVQVGAPVDSNLAAGVIAAQSPAAGQVASGATVTISPSTGLGVVVPTVSGKSLQDALTALRGAGFNNLTPQCQQTAGANGAVTGTTPGAGQMARGNTPITVIYQAADCGGGNGGGHGNGNGGH